MRKLTCLFLAFILILPLIGCKKKAAVADPFTPDYPTISPTEPEDPSQILSYRRDVVEQAMREQSAVLWTPAEDFTYSMKNNSLGIAADSETDPERVVTLEAGKIYQGIPYAHGSGSYYSWLSYATAKDENGVYTLTGITDQHLTGKSSYKENVRARLGNDCADQLFWAWGRICSSISFRGTNTMTPFYGCLPVGDYEFSGTQFNENNNTKDIVARNGEQRMFAAYAQLQKGDGMVLVNRQGAGHAVMVVTTNPVYTAEGQIDGEKSYVTVLEQTSGPEASWEGYYNEQLQQTVYRCEIMDKEWTYNTLIQKGYLPVTIRELIDPSPLPEPEITDYTDAPAADNMFRGIVNSNYRISSITVTIFKGDTIAQEATCFGHQEEMFAFNLFRFTSPTEQPVMQGSINLESLKPGQYRCTFTARISTGEEICFRDFTLIR